MNKKKARRLRFRARRARKRGHLQPKDRQPKDLRPKDLRREAIARDIPRIRRPEYIKHRISGKTPDEAMKLAAWTHILSLQKEVAKLPEVSGGSSVRTLSGGAFEMNRRKH
jgi:hypothetical protein